MLYCGTSPTTGQYGYGQAVDINKYVLSKARFDDKDADAMYDRYLGYAGVDVEKARAPENEGVSGAKPGLKMGEAKMLADNEIGTVSDTGGEQKVESKKRRLR